MDCSCVIDVDLFGDAIYELFSKHISEGGDHAMVKCIECGESVDTYTVEVGVYQGELTAYATCPDCMAIRTALFCSFYFGTIWSDLDDAFSDHEAEGEELTIPESCLAELTPKTRAQVCELLEAHWAALDKFDEEETA